MDETMEGEQAPTVRMKTTLGQRLKMAREWAGLTVEEAAARADTCMEAIEICECSPTPHAPGLPTILADTYRVRLEWLRGDPEEPDTCVVGIAHRLAQGGAEKEAVLLEKLIAYAGPSIFGHAAKMLGVTLPERQ